MVAIDGFGERWRVASIVVHLHVAAAEMSATMGDWPARWLGALACVELRRHQSGSWPHDGRLAAAAVTRTHGLSIEATVAGRIGRLIRLSVRAARCDDRRQLHSADV